ncbi:DUF3887 domain-containing protein [Paenibacillus sp. IB182496]|uniref:DUF3887 domain-containing protein n=1 Tax=Paenibacillus sabuli TaxID=2772509 RepID=A0A927BUJ8_9BACL|nr:DUF3887 domain-containing protein [Paenibacillus sabuli]
MVQAFIAGHFDEVYDQFDAALADAVSRETLQSGWEAVGPTLGEFEATTVMQQAEVDGMHAAAVRAAFSEQQLKFQIAFHAGGRLASISSSPLYDQPAAEMPTSVQEEPVVLGEDTDYPLEGLILQGETDFQVKADVDYVLWQERQYPITQAGRMDLLRPPLSRSFPAPEACGSAPPPLARASRRPAAQTSLRWCRS